MFGSLVCVLLAAGPQTANGSWTPPPRPDPKVILDEAREDARSGKHDVALAKFLWFHRNALTHQQSLYGVRLSFALAEWKELGEVYAPALDALKKTRDDALADFRRQLGDDDGFHAFHDFAAINRQLDDEAATVAEFTALDKKHPELARRVFTVVQGPLIGARQYALYGKYVDPMQDWLRAAQMYQLNRSMEARMGPQHKSFTEQAFTSEVSTLLAILVVNGRRDEAEAIAKKARLEWDDPGFHAALDSALAGAVPEPWP